MKEYFKRLHRYCEDHSSTLSTVLDELERETNLKTLAPQMLAGKYQGQLFRMLSLMIQPSKILEIGTFTGYSAICLAAGLKKGGHLHTVEANPELEYIIRKYVDIAGLQEKITLHMGNAEEIVPQLDEQFDLVFIDAGKRFNELFYEMSLEKLVSGGIILIDNVLWSGKVLTESDLDTSSILAFNEKISEDIRVEQILLPVRDGLFVVRKL